jgi:DNA-directed RNA polymerase specialized sigma24 family protein
LTSPTRPPVQDEALFALDEVSSRLAYEDQVAARVVELRQFAGLGHEEVAAVLGINGEQARQSRAYARAWRRNAHGGCIRTVGV